jgi:SAM-dependent methyltransferase
MTLLAEDARLWDIVFSDRPEGLPFLKRLVRDTGPNVLDVGCATGKLSRALRKARARPVGVDVNPVFIEAARAKNPSGTYVVGDMRTLRLRKRFDVVLCLGTTLAYCGTNDEVAATLRGFFKHLRPGGVAVIDVLNAAALIESTAFYHQSMHSFEVDDGTIFANISHRLDLENQRMTEQVTWRGRKNKRGWTRRDPEEWLRLFFPQELAYFLRVAGFSAVELSDRFGPRSLFFEGRRLVARATRRT